MRYVEGRQLLLALACTYASMVNVSAQHINLLSSPGAFQEAREVAEDHHLRYLVNPKELKGSVAKGELVELPKNENYIFSGSFPYAVPQAVPKLTELALEFKSLCKRPLRINSATRTARTQPKNAATNSLHRTGIAFDLEIPSEVQCRNSFESVLRFLERRKELFTWKVRSPPHYHMAVNIDAVTVEESRDSPVLAEVESDKVFEEPEEVKREVGWGSFLTNFQEKWRSVVSPRILFERLVQLLVLLYVLWSAVRFLRRST